MRNATQYKALLQERDKNERDIARMTRRNKEIDKVVKTVSALMSGKTKLSLTVAQPMTRPERAKPTEIRAGIGLSVLAALANGETRTVTDITGDIYGEATKDDATAVSNACSSLVKSGKLVRVKRGTYKMKRGSGNGKATSANIGHDTRIIQKGSRAEN